MQAAVVPHYDNAEGGNHDTRFCYMGERRLRILERQLPPGTFILGVDSHTALVLDLDRRTATVHGLGGVTVRVDGRGAVFPSGSEMGIDALADAARGLAAGETVHGDRRRADGQGRRDAQGERRRRAGETLHSEMTDLEGAFIGALGLRDGRAAVAALLDLDSAIESRIRAGEDSPDLDNARSTFRALIARLGEAVPMDAVDPRSRVDPFIDALVVLRARARDARDWATADLIREQLAGAGIEVRDGADGSRWVLAGSPSLDEGHDQAPLPESEVPIAGAAIGACLGRLDGQGAPRPADPFGASWEPIPAAALPPAAPPKPRSSASTMRANERPTSCGIPKPPAASRVTNPWSAARRARVA